MLLPEGWLGYLQTLRMVWNSGMEVTWTFKLLICRVYCHNCLMIVFFLVGLKYVSPSPKVLMYYWQRSIASFKRFVILILQMLLTVVSILQIQLLFLPVWFTPKSVREWQQCFLVCHVRSVSKIDERWMEGVIGTFQKVQEFKMSNSKYRGCVWFKTKVQEGGGCWIFP